MPTPRAPRNSRGLLLPQRLSHALSAIAASLPNLWDESDDYFTPFSAPFAASEALAGESLRKALGVGPRYHLDLAEVDLAGQAAEYGDDAVAEGYRTLETVMQATLTEIRRVSARGPHVVRVRTWLVGRHPSGWLVGLRTVSTET